MHLATPLGRLRLIGNLEGWSFVVLLFIAMPLKYLADQPEAVRIVGMAHGILFVGAVIAVAHAHFAYRWRWQRSLLLVGAMLLPFGPFIADRKLLRRLPEEPRDHAHS
jgi:integral membrane protein